MEVILRQDVDELGLEGDIVKVAKGYAHNFLVPNGLALQATPQNRKALELQRKKIEVKRLRGREDAEKLKEKIGGLVIHVSQKAGEEGKLYGSVTTMDIAGYLEAQGIEIDRRKIILDKPIKTVGEYTIPVRIYPKVTASIKVSVSPEQEQRDAGN
ncbi:MAG: large subunit ribosomal protein [Thermodesulfobacteriota bacterium]|nr:large subunit ribosomal protein [Thermodesulfobacteriota bacterium]